MFTALPGRVAAAAALLLAFACPSASAQIFRAYLSVNGNDANACTLGAPCRLLPAAIAAVQDGGEIWMMDSGNFNTGPVAITKSVTILAIPGALGSIVALGGNAINIGTPPDNTLRITLRNLNILPFAGSESFTGVSMTGGNWLTVQGCNIFNFKTGYGIHVVADVQVSIIDSVIRGNQNGAIFDGGATARIADSKILNNLNYGAAASSNSGGVTTLTVSHSVAGGNLWGFLAEALSPTANARLFVIDSVMESGNSLGAGAQVSGIGGAALATVSNSLVVGNFIGLRAANSGAVLIASGNTLSQNATGLANVNGIVQSAGNNINGDMNTGTITTLSPS